MPGQPGMISSKSFVPLIRRQSYIPGCTSCPPGNTAATSASGEPAVTIVFVTGMRTVSDVTPAAAAVISSKA